MTPLAAGGTVPVHLVPLVAAGPEVVTTVVAVTGYVGVAVLVAARVPSPLP